MIEDLDENLNNSKTEHKMVSFNHNVQHPTSRFIILVIILSLIFGGVGGSIGAIYIMQKPGFNKLFSSSENSIVSQNIVLNEDSAVIDVVKKTKDAVVSIVVSKDLSKIPGYSLDPFSTDPFFNFFYNGGQSQQEKSTKPNIQQIGAGSGFFVNADGLILTNKHVVEDDSASYTVLTQDGKKYEAKVLAKDPVGDLAIVKIEIQNAPYLKLTNSNQLQIGQRVVAIGNSLGQYQNTVTSGIVSGIGRKITAGGQEGTEELSGVIQTDAAINPGNSGGPLLNLLGEVVGINTAIDQQGQLVGFAIPAVDGIKALDSFNKNGKITRIFLGVRYINLTPALAEEQKLPKENGALIVRGQTTTDFAVLPGSPADKAGLVENDIILEVDGKKIDEKNSLADLLKDKRIGEKVNLKVYHKGEEKTVSVVLEEGK